MNLSQMFMAGIICWCVYAGFKQIASIGSIVTRQATPETERAADNSMLPVALLVAAGLVVGLSDERLRATMPEHSLLVAGVTIAAIILPQLVRGRLGALLAVLAFVAAGVVIVGGVP